MSSTERAFWSNQPSGRTRGKAKTAQADNVPVLAPESATVLKPPPASVPVSKAPANATVSQPIKSGAPGQALAAQRRVIAHTCLQCDTEFTGIVIAVYCSNRCRQRAKYARR